MNSRFVICIPVFDNPKTIVSVIESCLNLYDYPLIVVDDGSEIPVQELYLKKIPEGNPRIDFLRHPKNAGKGIALQTAFRQAVQDGYTHLVSIDGDGQHMASDVAELVQASLSCPWSIIIGDRQMQKDQAPKSSIFGKKFSNFWVRYQTQSLVHDSQSGFRIYPLFFIQGMKFFCKKYDFEIEILIRLIWKGVDVENVPISVQYFMEGGRVSHFHKWKDNYRISVLNTLLTMGSMLREQTSPLKSSLALGVGVFVGTLPVYGLHTGIAAGLAFLFRLNFVYMWVGTNISLPPFLPFLVVASNHIGSRLSGASGNSVAKASENWLLGSVVLGLGLGFLAFLINYGIKTRAEKRKKAPAAWSGKNQNQLGIAIVQFVLKKLGLPSAYFILYFIVFYYYLFSQRTRKSLSEYWKIIHPELGFFARQRKMYRQILLFAQTLVDRGWQRQHEGLCFSYETDASVEGFLSHLKNRKEGIVAIASHVGGWELAMSFFAQVSTEKKMLAIMHGLPDQYEHNSMSDTSASKPVYFNLQSNTIFKVKDYLDAGQVVGMMADRPVTHSYELVPFFGHLAVFDTTPFRAALACKADVYFIFSVKISMKQYKVFAFPAKDFREKSSLDEVLRQYVKTLETIVEAYPEQWFNFFPFWSETNLN